MRQVDENRNVEPAGYCTFNCDDDSECKPGMRCEMAMETGSHAGSKWDGSFHKNIKVCVKR